MVIDLVIFICLWCFIVIAYKQARGMMSMMKQLGIPSFGSHHLGIDDTKNIARVLQRMVVNGAHIKITARRNPKLPDNVQFLFENRIR